MVDAHTPGFGTTGGTSAHINTFADTTYKEAESAFGNEGAQLFADAVNEGFALIKDNINRYKINCDFEDKPGYLYAEDEDQAKQLDDIYQGANQVGVAAAYMQEVPTPVDYVKALLFEGQAQFHPLKYLQGLLAEFKSSGGKLLENSMVDEVLKDGEVYIAKAGELDIKAASIIYATHLPPKITSFSFRCAPYRG
ncbi:NAD(P)/FAD-dependent oxidoreductase [Mucilaginibacter sp. UYNi724]